MAHFTTLYSGSSGNCALLEESGRFLLVDLGKSCRAAASALKELGLAPSGLGGILITHEHHDHISGLHVFLKKWNVPVYGPAATLDFLCERGIIPPSTQLEAVEGRQMDVAGFGVESFSTSHDSVACCGYRITSPKGKTIAIATDLGYVSDEVMANLYCADAVALEANYDIYKLAHGPYPPYLQARISSRRGHLSNDESAAALIKLMQNGCDKFCLCHISQENNEPALALGSVQAAMYNAGIAPDSVQIQAASRHQISTGYTL